ncbi:hypothetical protein PoB_003537400 [Plakobranchus ocellatus]|uniref:Uncharacterized protein n=1 Tax=Plakobranchus ocellatus TaxID=259542 RepID=A0AAV4AM86_9GAST|nr:hypothetical protein PoB_003537400 [Plakobranchus ocellatus]
MTSRLGSVGQRCPPVSGEGSGQGGMLISDSHYCRAVTTSTSRIHPSPHTGRTSRQNKAPTLWGWASQLFPTPKRRIILAKMRPHSAPLQVLHDTRILPSFADMQYRATRM